MSNPKYDKIKIEEIRPDWVRCPNCNRQFKLTDTGQWSGMMHIHCGQRLIIANRGKVKEFVWCIVANVTERGTNRLKAGTKTFLYPYPWMGDSSKVVGKDFETNRFIEIIISRKWLTNFRVEKVTKVDLISRFIQHCDESDEFKKTLEEGVEMYRNE